MGAPGTQPFQIIAIGPTTEAALNFDASGGLHQVAVGFGRFGGNANERVQITLHDIRIVAVPAPGSWVLFSAGAALMLARRRR